MGMFDLFSNKSAENAAAAQIAGLNNARTSATNAINQGLSDYKTENANTLGMYDQLNATGSAANKTYADALGLNGADGALAAQQQYTTLPGYQFQMDQGMQALDRQRAASGSLASGGASADAIKYAQGLASQDYNSWLDRLSGLNSQYSSTTNARAATSSDLADKLYGTGTTLGQINWNADTGIGNALAQSEMNKYNVAGNQLGAVMGGASLGARLLGFG